MLSTRISIQWPPQTVGEDTSTMVISSKNGHFVDIRIFLENYPIIDEDPKDFHKVFEWTMVGDEIEMESDIPNTYKLKFTHEIDSMAIWKSIESGLPLDECVGDADVGIFWNDDSVLDRKETGNMLNSNTGKHQDYIEMWRSLSPSNHTPTHEVRESDQDKNTKTFVLRTQSDLYHGQMIRAGNWIQGLLYDKKDTKVPLKVLRAFYNGEKWEYLIKYGKFQFPMDFNGSVNDSITIDDVVWKCIE